MKHMWKSLIIGIGLQASQQLTGINAIFYFSTSKDMFKDLMSLSFRHFPKRACQKWRCRNCSGTRKRLSLFRQVQVGAIAVVITLVAGQVIDRLGRRSLLISSLLGMMTFFIILSGTIQIGKLLHSGSCYSRREDVWNEWPCSCVRVSHRGVFWAWSRQHCMGYGMHCFNLIVVVDSWFSLR